LSFIVFCCLELIQLVEKTIRSENLHCPDRPIYLVGESIGACLALALAARNPAIDLVLILANPGESVIHITGFSS